MHQKKIICFDFDGTLVDSSVFVHSSLIKTAQDFGHSEINDNNLEEYFGPTEIGILKKILGPEEAIAASPYFYRIYRFCFHRYPYSGNSFLNFRKGYPLLR